MLQFIKLLIMCFYKICVTEYPIFMRSLTTQ